MAKTIVVLGASYGGLGVVHKLLKTAPADTKVILVSPSTHLYWNIAAPRAVIPNAIPDETLIRPLAPGLAHYPPETFQLLIGAATAVDPSSGAVTIVTSAQDQGEPLTLAYDALVVATGARYADADMPWKSSGTYQDVLDRLHATRDKIATASHVVVAGGGATGVETAAELGYSFVAGKPADSPERKQVTLLSAGPVILNGDSIAAGVEKELASLGVVVANNSSVLETRPTPEGKIEVVVEGSDAVVCDVYLATMGLRPNSEFLPEEMLTEKGYMDVNDAFQARAFSNVFGVGDIVSIPRAGYAITDWQAPQVARNVELFLKDLPPKPVSQLPVDVLLTSLGPKRGAGRINSIKMPSFVVSRLKSKSLAIERAAKTISGGSVKN